MKTYINHPVHTTKMRVLSAFMAFLVLMLTFQEALVGWDFGARVSAAIPTLTPGDGTITASSALRSKYMGQSSGTGAQRTSHTSDGTTSNGTYTGRIKQTAVSVYDYLTDDEITGTWNSINNNSYTWHGYYDPYTIFNGQISNDTQPDNTSDNVTIKYKINGISSFSGYKVYVLFKSTSQDWGYGWQLMKEESSHSGYVQYTYTLPYGRIKEQLANNSISYIEFKVQKGNTSYYAKRDTSDHKFEIKDSWGRNMVHNFYSASSQFTGSSGDRNYTHDVSTSPAEAIIYSNPLYFGFFDRGPNTNSGYTSSNKPAYNNFYWQANIAQRQYHDSANVPDAPKTATQKLADSTISNGALTQGGVELPYFNSEWADNHKYSSSGTAKDTMKYWESGSSDASKIYFPFYETLNEISSGQYAKYYQFNSKDSNLVFHEPDGSHTAAYFTESATDIESATGTLGYFPFNSTNDTNTGSSKGKTLNYGFGTKFELTFKLSSDGKTEAVDENGKKITSGAVSKVDTKFEFSGDDDLWVFIDGNLVLDIGGDHAASTGTINFATATATVDRAITYGTGSNDDLSKGQSASSKSISLLNKVSGLTQSGSTYTYDEDTVHTMTIFHMERGMSESNLYIRYNFVPDTNYSKMKIKEQTDFSNVNAGLKAVAQKAAENDIFQYTIKNKGTDSENVLNNNYTSTQVYTRNVQNVSTQINSGAITTNNFNPADTTTLYNVANVSYNWVDEYATNSSNAKMDSDAGVGANTGSNGELYLWHGIAQDSTLAPSDEIKSSAEFEGQFDRYSTMQITQANNLYYNSASGGVAVPAVSTRDVDTYYTRTQSIFSKNHSAVSINNGAQFNFRNGINDSDVTVGDSSSNPDTGDALKNAVQMTELFTNTVKTGSLSVTKNVDGSNAPAADTQYTFKLTLTDVFGVSGNDVTDYSGITVNGASMAADGTFTLTKNGTATINGIPVGTQYTVTETVNQGATAVTSSPDPASGTVEYNTTSSVSFTNTFTPQEIDITVRKTTTDHGDPSGAEMELWYKETITPPTYSFNDPQIIPYKRNGMIVDGTLSVPGPAESSSSYTYYTQTPTYSNPTVPSSDDTNWILPRNDTDYIYFRDFNTGTTGEWDSPSFNNTSKDATYNTNGSAKTSWRATNFAAQAAASANNPGTHNQKQELDYDESYWFAAEFSGSGKQTVRYAMWERFVDNYNSNITTVWKIQPPDGYTTVRFMLLKGDTVVRKTQAVNYQLGKIYHKTSWGGYWTSKDGQNCYYDVPVTAEGYWAPESNSVTDKRMETSGTMSQARKYEPTERKIIFTCNSQQVWHNIHIEFFTSNSESSRVNGQAFPGYMMEPYAYAENNYRLRANGVEQYLTYELTIPANATHFRINNGVASGPYSYMTAITPIANEANVKNGGNYYILGGSGNYNNRSFTLYNCLSGLEGNHNVPLYRTTAPYTQLTGDNIAETYSDSEITTDYDYIYFKRPSDWGSNGNVYAYFYGGGNLRDDNWQRACYSAWPGVAPVGTEYDSVHSNTYSTHTTGNEYNGTDTSGALSPEATFSDGSSTIYKFRIPMGDRKNYSKVVFNNGLSSQSGGKETGVIDYKSGYIYDKSGTATKHYESSPTVTYTGRTNSAYTSADQTEYIYIKNTDGWDDPHITFYDANGSQILQSGKGYVMDYAGTDGAEYYRMPIPANAAKFSVNNGMGSANASKVTAQYDIIRYSASTGEPTSTQSADDKFVYDLSGTALTRMTYNAGTPVAHTVTTTQGQTENTDNYTNGVRKTGTVEHTLNIRDAASWDVPIGGASVTFYGANGAVVGSGTMINTNADADGKVWYTKKIPDNAVSFAVSYTKSGSTKTTDKYPIFGTTADSNGNVTTSGNMYYDTTGVSALTMINAAQAYPDSATETYPSRGDFLYLRSDTEITPPTVTFYAGSVIVKQNVSTTYLNQQDGKYWYRVSIPTGADSFKVGSDNTSYPIYELKTKYSPYQKDYTLGNMQYDITPSPAALLYPVFTQDDEYTLHVSDDKIITSGGGLVQVDDTAVSQYANASAETRAATTAQSSQSPVLYQTSSTDVTYNWTEGSGESTSLRLKKESWYTNANVRFYTGSWSSYSSMTSESSSNWIINTIPSGATKVQFQLYKDSTWVTTDEKTLPSDVTTTNYQYSVTYTPGCQYSGYLTIYGSSSYLQHLRIYMWNSTSNTGSLQNMDSGFPTGLSVSGYTAFRYSIPSNTNYTNAIIINDNNDNLWCTHISDIANGGRGQVYQFTSKGSQYESHWDMSCAISNNSKNTSLSYDSSSTSFQDSYTIGSATAVGSITPTVSYTAQYQPEDRYGYISDVNGSADINNCITINTSVSDPYIIFYTDDNGTSGNEIGGSTATNGGMKMETLDRDGTAGSPYVIRLPKNARSFAIASGADGTAGTAFDLYPSSITVNASDGQLTGSGDQVTLSDFHHAGSTFNATASNITLTDVRGDSTNTYTTAKADMEDPLNPKTDADFVFLTVPSGVSWTTPYAYFYGDQDGEYAFTQNSSTVAWPGVRDSGHYTDKSGRTVYRFQIPKNENGKYSYVMFNNGGYTSGSISESVQFSAGENYVLTTGTTKNYGTNVTAYALTPTDKAPDTATQDVIGSGNNYIYIRNNGTQNFTSGSIASGRTTLDEMHIVFFADPDGAVPVGNGTADAKSATDNAGYIPDKVIAIKIISSKCHRI